MLQLEKKYLDNIEAAEEFLKAAESLVATSFKSAANRLYFALEQAIIAYLNKEGIEVPKNHQQSWELSRKLGNEYYDALRELYDLRMQADYGTISTVVPLAAETVKLNVQTTKNLIRTIKTMISKEDNTKKVQ